MIWAAQHVWFIPLLPLIAAGASALLKRPRRMPAAALAIGAMAAAFALAAAAFAWTLSVPAGEARLVQNFTWLELGGSSIQLGTVLDPLGAVMLVMITFVSLLIFIFSVGYMAHDDNFTRFFCFLSLFAAAMLGVVVANSLLLLFVCWELVGLASYLLIGFWFHKPSAAAAAKKAFLTTRIGDMALLLGMLWLYTRAGTLLFYDGGNGCLEIETIGRSFSLQTHGMLPMFGIAVLLFVGAMSKSGQFPLHVWLPDAMEGPTPVSALIHAATMVAAGVFLVARVFPLMCMLGDGLSASPNPQLASQSSALNVVTWIGAITAVFAASIAVAQTDIKRILAYSTVSQLGYMMMGLGVGGVAVGMFHLITHAFFKALLFLGAGSVIHGCHEEQDIRRMGGLRKLMPVTFATYAVGMLALAGFPVLFSGFWSKDAILHAAHQWPVSHGPFYLGLTGAFLTAFYMTRQMCVVFFGEQRDKAAGHAHESAGVMTVPLMLLAAMAILLSFVGTPLWPWFQSYLTGAAPAFDVGALRHEGVAQLLLLSSAIVFAGLGVGWWFYGRRPVQRADDADPIEHFAPAAFRTLRGKFFVDEFYEWTVIRWVSVAARVCDWCERWLWSGLVFVCQYAGVAFGWCSRLFDEYVINAGFDRGCGRVRWSAWRTSALQSGQLHSYLRIAAVAVAALVLLLIWAFLAQS